MTKIPMPRSIVPVLVMPPANVVDAVDGNARFAAEMVPALLMPPEKLATS